MNFENSIWSNCTGSESTGAESNFCLERAIIVKDVSQKQTISKIRENTGSHESNETGSLSEITATNPCTYWKVFLENWELEKTLRTRFMFIRENFV